MIERIVRLDGRLQPIQVAGEARLVGKLIDQGWVEMVDHWTVVDPMSNSAAEALNVTQGQRSRVEALRRCARQQEMRHADWKGMRLASGSRQARSAGRGWRTLAQQKRRRLRN